MRLRFLPLLFLMAPALAWAQAEAPPFPADCGVRGEGGKAELTASCLSAVEAEPTPAGKAAMLFSLAYALNERDAALASLPLLERAVALVPEHAGYHHELGYTRADLGFYREAAADLDRALAIDPDFVLSLNERAWVRTRLGDFEGALADLDRSEALEGETPGTLRDRADNLTWLGRLDEADAALAKLPSTGGIAEAVAERRRAIARMRAYRPAGDTAAICKQESAETPEEARVTFDACTHAFVNSADPVERADFLTTRYMAALVAEGSYEAVLLDATVAVGLDPSASYRHSNYGQVLLNLRRSWAARNAFDAALALPSDDPRDRGVALYGRALANYIQGDPEQALRDAEESVELFADGQALTILGHTAYENGDEAVAKQAWRAAYDRGSRDPDLLDGLRELGVEILDPEAGEVS